MKTAVIGIGSNSVRMLVAQIEGDTGIRLRRDREGTRLFSGLDASRMLSESAMEITLQAVHRMASSAWEEGAQYVHLFATSATRDARNADVFAQMLKERTGLSLIVCSGEEEASLSFMGATGKGYCGVIDIGGGSTEIISGEGEELRFSFSCQMGAVRLSRIVPIQSHEDLNVVIAKACEILEERFHPYASVALPLHWYGTGGTFTTLAAMVRGVPWTDRTNMHGTLLTQENVAAYAHMLSDMSVEARKRLPGIQPHRADIIVHGICILLACMQRLSISEIRVSEYGNLDGYLKKSCQLSCLI
ncbi:MAG: hypothetical protein IJ246_01080 [Clostridia bacterium]|nr:hypothetical protein [Clostridia bacterium]